jgi:hypothetical protein
MDNSAVEYLAEKLLENQTYDRDGYVIIDLSVDHLEYLVQRAKEMEKEQIIESYCQGCFDISKDENIYPRETSEQYYNETFKSE